MRIPPPTTVPRRWGGLAAIAAALASLSCGRWVERSTVISTLETVQRPFDLHGLTVLGIPVELPAHLLLAALLAALLTWLSGSGLAWVSMGALIVGKEVLDLAIIGLYEPITWSYALNSALDMSLSIAGVAIGVVGVTRARRRRKAESGSP